MYSVWMDALIGVLVAWVAILTVLLWRQTSFLNRLFPKESNGNITNKLEEVLASIEDFRKREKILTKNLKDQLVEGLGHIQTVEISRYNPYADTGGNISFSIVLIDGKLNGVLLTSLHSRAGTRAYCKQIINGKSDVQLSREEADLLEKAIAGK